MCPSYVIIIPRSMLHSGSFLLFLLCIQFLIRNVEPQRRSLVCPPGKTQIPNPDDPHSFYKCDAAGNPILFTCPPKTWFNPRLEVCDWDTGNYEVGNNWYSSNQGDNVQNGNWKPSTSQGVTSGNGYPLVQANNSGGNTYNIIHININGVSGIDKHQANNQLNEGNNFQTNYSSHGQPFYPSGNKPNYSSDGGNDYPLKLSPNASCPPNGPLFYQNPEDCSTYYTCNQGRMVLTYCTRGNYYIPERKRCETNKPKGCKFVNNNIIGGFTPIKEPDIDIRKFGRKFN